VTIEFIRNGTVGVHTYNISFVQTRFESQEYSWQLNHTDIIAEELIVPTVTVTITQVVTVIVTVTETVTITVTEIVTVTERITVTEVLTETLVVSGLTPMEAGLGMVTGAAVGAASVALLFLLRARRSKGV